MTRPSPNGTPAASGASPAGIEHPLLDVLVAHFAAAELLEHRAAASAVNPVQATARATVTWGARQWTRTAGALTAALPPSAWTALRESLTRLITGRPPVPAAALLDGGYRALRLGEQQGAVELGVRPPTPAQQHPLSGALHLLAADAENNAQERWRAAVRLLNADMPAAWPDLVTKLAPLHTAATDIDRASRYITNHALNQGLADVADHHDTQLLWIAERDACVVCLALSGDVVGRDEDFNAHATFGDKPIPWYRPPGQTLLRPPRHNRCRCRVSPYAGQRPGGGPVSLPQALKREAMRSILRGWSLPSESERVRIRAADRLLRRGTSLPKSVQQYASHAVDEGHFPNGREVPSTSKAARNNSQ